MIEKTDEHSSDLQTEIEKRRTFAIISHPDAGKTTVTEQLLLHGNAIQLAGTVKSRKSDRYAVSDWMAMEKERGISVTTSVMQFDFLGCVMNLLDTPGHADFSEDTYRTLTAVDSALMVIDGVKGVEQRTRALLEVCRMRTTPIWTFVNKLDREIKEPVMLLDEIEKELGIQCAPITWPIGCGQHFKGAYHLYEDRLYLVGGDAKGQAPETLDGLQSNEAKAALGDEWQALCDDVELVRGASHAFDLEACLAGRLTPVYFGTALKGFGVSEWLRDFTRQGPRPQMRETSVRSVLPTEDKFSGFVFKVQANMNPKHRDRMAFMRICSGCYRPGMKLRQARSGISSKVKDAVFFMAHKRAQVNVAYAGDIIGLHNHGGIRVGDTYTEGEHLQFRGIPYFAPVLFKRIQLRNPLKSKQLRKGMRALFEEGAGQFFEALTSNDLMLGAIGLLQFDVVSYRLEEEYGAHCTYMKTDVQMARWVTGPADRVAQFKRELGDRCATDFGDQLTYLATSVINMQLVEEKWSELSFHAAREH